MVTVLRILRSSSLMKRACNFCCDAPDYNEADENIKLEQLRIPIEEVMPYLSVLAHLSTTPSEAEAGCKTWKSSIAARLPSKKSR